jgi:aspartate aminotransferase-like enzyme
VPTPEPIRFGIAASPAEFEQIFLLNYDTFVEEIPQHVPNAARRLVDCFHDENTYLIAAAGDEVVGMVAMRGRRPFSLDGKLGDVMTYLPPGRRVCELRLLAVRPEYRKGIVFRGLVDLVLRHGLAQGYDLAIISGTVRQLRLYRHLGFVPFGPLVGSAGARFQPMSLTIEQFERSMPALSAPRDPVSFLPGPAQIPTAVQAAFERPPAYHRDRRFCETFDRVKARLCALTNAPHVELLLGSGTLANDVVAAQISRLDAPGLVLSNGEFGDRLIDHAARMRLAAAPLRTAWGARFDVGRVEQAVVSIGARWIWAVASETSTGMLNDVPALGELARQHGVALCLDCVSAIGAAPLDLSGVYLASGASGKALAALPGLSFVFYADDVRPEPARLPRYLDLGVYAASGGIPFTQSSNLVAALEAALTWFAGGDRFAEIAAHAAWLRSRLRALRLPILVDDGDATPAVVTLPLPPDTSARALGDWLQRRGFLVAYQSEYLAARNWLQIALMGDCSAEALHGLVSALASWAARLRDTPIPDNPISDNAIADHPIDPLIR